MGFIWEGSILAFKKGKVLTRIHGKQQIYLGAMLEHEVNGGRGNLRIDLVPERTSLVPK